MAYNNAIPQSTDVPSASQSQLLGNFASLNTQFGTDHVPLIAGSNNGFHNKCTWLDQTASPPSSASGNVTAYAITNGGVTMPYYQRDGIGNAIPLSPIKAFGKITLAGNNSSSLSAGSWNLPSIASTVGSAGQVTITVNVTANVLKTTNQYGIFITAQTGIANGNYVFVGIPVSTTQFQAVIYAPGGSIPSLGSFAFAVQVLEL